MPRGRGYVQNAQQRLERAKKRMAGGGAAGGRGRGGRGKLGKSPMPWDSQAQRESAELGNEGADARSSLAGAFDRAQRQLGFGVGADDPYSGTAQNRKQLATDQRGIGTTAGNQLYAGATANAQSQARSSYDQTQKGLEDEFAQAQTSYTGGVARTARDEQMGAAGIKEGALDRRAATTPAPLGVGGRGRGGRGRGAIREGQNVRRPAEARKMNAQARAITARLNKGGRGRV